MFPGQHHPPREQSRREARASHLHSIHPQSPGRGASVGVAEDTNSIIRTPLPHRTNPGIADGHQMTASWCYSCGITEETAVTWRRYREADPERIIGYCYPDARGADHELAIDMMCQFVATDDSFESTFWKDPGVGAGYLEAVSEVLYAKAPVDSGRFHAPLVKVFIPTWERSCEGMSPAWRERDPDKVVWLSRTTLPVDETMEAVDALRGRYPNLLSPPSDDICYATQNRQQAVRQIAGRADLVIVVGSRNSSNSLRLVEVALSVGVRDAHLIDCAEQIDQAWLHDVGTVGLTSGASVPEVLVEDVLRWLAQHGYNDVETITAAKENQHFALPRPLGIDHPSIVQERHAHTRAAFDDTPFVPESAAPLRKPADTSPRRIT